MMIAVVKDEWSVATEVSLHYDSLVTNNPPKASHYITCHQIKLIIIILPFCPLTKTKKL
jgi:hypothetical protein